MSKRYKPVVLLIMDGVGINISSPESTWKYAKAPTFRELERFFPFTTLQASGTAVGLPWGEEGNSEVGHLTIGAGAALFHHLPRIIVSIQDRSFYRNPAFLEALNFISKRNGRLHIMGLFSSGSVHAYIDHLYALLEFAKINKLKETYLHLFTDGRDAPTDEAGKFLEQFEEKIAMQYPFAKIATIMGRFFAMDRDEGWDRIERAYRALIGEGDKNFKEASDYVTSAYKAGATDEFIEPASLEGGEGKIQSGDAVIFFNFREDSVRELASAFLADDFANFPRQKINSLFFVTMTEYDKHLPAIVAFPPLDVPWPLGRIISEAGLKQLHIAETEKYAHVTYFFNGGREDPFPREDRVLVRSQRISRFDESPEMSIAEVTEKVISNLPNYDFILVNFANGDMVGHTGNFDATVKALEAIDRAVGQIAEEILKTKGALVITADHGNAEEKIYSVSGEKRTKHTSDPVPFFVVADGLKRKTPRGEDKIKKRYEKTEGVLSDIAPTVLALMDLPPKAEMTGINILPKIL